MPDELEPPVSAVVLEVSSPDAVDPSSDAEVEAVRDEVELLPSAAVEDVEDVSSEPESDAVDPSVSEVPSEVSPHPTSRATRTPSSIEMEFNRMAREYARSRLRDMDTDEVLLTEEAPPGPGRWSAELEFETTSREIVDVIAITGPKATTGCLVEAAWAVQLSWNFHDERKTHRLSAP